MAVSSRPSGPAIYQICHLPRELEDMILQLLGAEQTSSSRAFRHQPSLPLLRGERPLKNLSSTCRYLRKYYHKMLLGNLRLRLPEFKPYTNGSHKPSKVLGELFRLREFIEQSNLAAYIRRITVFVPKGTRMADGVVDSFLWTLIGRINPPSVMIIAPPAILCDLNYGDVSGGTELSLGRKFDVLLLKQSEHRAYHQPIARDQLRRGLLGLRPWTEIRLNEGSALPPPGFNEYDLTQMPSVIHRLLDSPFRQSKLMPLVFLQHFEYTTMFPWPTHVSELAKALRSLPQIFSLSTQFLPAGNGGKESVEDPNSPRGIKVTNLLEETAETYGLLASKLNNAKKPVRLRQWTATDSQLDIDGIVGPHLTGWRMSKPRHWER